MSAATHHQGIHPELVPLVSVLMPTRNQQAYIGAALDSILQQDWPAIEIIIADGASTDGTVEYLTARAATDSRIRFFSEPDKGPADALNKALKRARGSIIGWLNSDDLYAEGAIRRAASALCEHPQWLMVYGHGTQRDERDGRQWRYPSVVPDQVVMDARCDCFICQPSAFFRYVMVPMLGGFDVSLKTAFDFDLWMRAFRAFPERIGFIDAVQAVSRLHEDCITVSQGQRVCVESMLVVTRYLGEVSGRWLNEQFSVLHAQVGSREGSGQTPRQLAVSACRQLLAQSATSLTQAQIQAFLKDPRCIL